MTDPSCNTYRPVAMFSSHSRLMGSLWPLASRRVARTPVNATPVSGSIPTIHRLAFPWNGFGAGSDFTSGFWGAAAFDALAKDAADASTWSWRGPWTAWPQPPRPCGLSLQRSRLRGRPVPAPAGARCGRMMFQMLGLFAEFERARLVPTSSTSGAHQERAGRAADRGRRRLGKAELSEAGECLGNGRAALSSADRSEAASTLRRYGFSICAKPSATTSDVWLL